MVQAVTYKEFTEEWIRWIHTNVERGCSRDQLFRILVGEGFDPRAAERALAHKPVVQASIIARLPNAKRLDSPRLELYRAESFLDAGECRRVVEAMKGKLRDSTISTPDEPDKYFRVSKTCDLGHLNDALMQHIDRNICAAIGIPETLSEVTQGQHYEPGGEFKAHTDYFEQHELERFSSPTLGQRSWTFMVYLNEPESGGETAFVNVGLVVKPRLGMAVIWNNLLPDGRPNPDSIHHGMPVKAGHKDIITKWFRVPKT